MSGIPASGKTTLGRELGTFLGIPVLDKDDCLVSLFDEHDIVDPASRDGALARTDIPRIRFHDLCHTHASVLVAAGTPIKVVSERLGPAHPGFTMATYQHLVPGMSTTAAIDFANTIANHRSELVGDSAATA